MSFFDLIHDLRKGVPDTGKAARAMKVLGWICLLGGVWNSVVPMLAPFEQSPFNIPLDFSVLALTVFLILGMLFFLAARGIANEVFWGRRLGQAAIMLLITAFFGFLALLLNSTSFPFSEFPRAVLVVFSLLFIGQFAVPAWFGIRYLGRLPVREEGDVIGPIHRTGAGERPAGSGRTRPQSVRDGQYKDSPVPFGVAGTFIALIAVPLLMVMIGFKIGGPEAAEALAFPAMVLIFASPVLYNRVASPFELARNPVASYIGGGSVFLLNASWPFFRLLVYSDGVEVRFMFHRFFIPYDRMEDLPEKTGFFSRGIRFRSDLPGVPSSIRFYGFGSKGILASIRQQRARLSAAEANIGSGGGDERYR